MLEQELVTEEKSNDKSQYRHLVANINCVAELATM